MKRYLFLVLLLCLPPFAAESVTGRKFTLAGLAQSADTVSIGRVVELRSTMIDGEMWTLATVTVEQAVKGGKNAVIRLRIPGGQQQVNGRTMVTRVEGAPVLNVNEKALLFLNSTDREYYDISGFNQGYWRVETREGKEMAFPADAEASPGLPLQFVLEEVREALNAQRRQN